jgi:hypothetical protein
MNLSIKFLRLNEYTHADDEVPPGTQYGFWRIVEHTGAGWFPWPRLFHTRERAQKALDVILKNAEPPAQS